MSDVATKIPDRIYTYVQTTIPGAAAEGESWFNPDTNDARVYDGQKWVDLTITDHGQLDGVDAADHHDPVSVDGNTLTRDNQALSVPDNAVTAAELAPDSVGASELAYNVPLATQDGRVTLAIGNALEVDADGRLAVSAESITDASIADNSLTESSLAADSVGSSELAFNTPLATQDGRVTVALGNALEVDADGRLGVAAESITNAEIDNYGVGRSSLNTDSVGNSELDRAEVAGDGIDTDNGLGIADDGVNPRHVDDNQTYDINVDRVDGNDAADLEQTAKKNALAADFIL